MHQHVERQAGDAERPDDEQDGSSRSALRPPGEQGEHQQVEQRAIGAFERVAGRGGPGDREVAERGVGGERAERHEHRGGGTGRRSQRDRCDPEQRQEHEAARCPVGQGVARLVGRPDDEQGDRREARDRRGRRAQRRRELCGHLPWNDNHRGGGLRRADRLLRARVFAPRSGGGQLCALARAQRPRQGRSRRRAVPPGRHRPGVDARRRLRGRRAAVRAATARLRRHALGAGDLRAGRRDRPAGACRCGGRALRRRPACRLADGSRELGILSHVLEHVPDPPALLAEVARVCARGRLRGAARGQPLGTARLPSASTPRRSATCSGSRARPRARIAGAAGLTIAAELQDPLPLEVHRFFAEGRLARGAATAKWAARAGTERVAPALARRAFTLHYAALCLPPGA